MDTNFMRYQTSWTYQCSVQIEIYTVTAICRFTQALSNFAYKTCRTYCIAIQCVVIIVIIVFASSGISPCQHSRNGLCYLSYLGNLETKCLTNQSINGLMDSGKFPARVLSGRMVIEHRIPSVPHAPIRKRSVLCCKGYSPKKPDLLY
jgi:hypothetical protein